MELYILRHGETDWNKQMRMQGQVDIPLNDFGRELARATKEGIKDIRFDYIFSSPLIRAVETAEIVTGWSREKIVTDDRIKEISFGEYEGKYPDERPPEFMNFFKSPELYRPQGSGESYEALCERTRDFIENVIFPIAEKEPESRVLISGHGAMNKALLLYFKKIEIKDIWSGPFQMNCCISRVDIKDSKSWEFIFENKIYYNAEEFKPLWLVKKIVDDDYGCEEKVEKEQFYIVYVESEKGEKKELRLSESFLGKNGILEGRYIRQDVLFEDKWKSVTESND